VKDNINPSNAELNPICHLLMALLGAHHILHISRIRVKEKLDVITWLDKGERTADVSYFRVSDMLF